MTVSLKDQAAIAGIGLTEFSRDSGISELNLAARCIKAACDDAGIDPSDIDGLVSYTLDHTDEIEVARAVGAGDPVWEESRVEATGDNRYENRRREDHADL